MVLCLTEELTLRGPDCAGREGCWVFRAGALDRPAAVYYGSSAWCD
jgi:hypothetical protein